MKKQPNSQNCFVCGISNPIGLKLKIYSHDDGSISSSFTALDHFQGYPGVVHGGIVASILDEISGRALLTDPLAPRFMFTGKLEVKYRKNVPINQPLTAIGKIIKIKGKYAEGWAGLYNSKNELLAEAKSILIDAPNDLLDNSSPDALGWKVYED